MLTGGASLQIRDQERLKKHQLMEGGRRERWLMAGARIRTQVPQEPGRTRSKVLDSLS